MDEMYKLFIKFFSDLFNSGIIEWLFRLSISVFAIVYVKTRSETWLEDQKSSKTYRRHLAPALKAAESLISRICDLLIVHSEPLNKKFNEFKAVEKSSEYISALKEKSPEDWTFFESTAYRLIAFLARAEAFRLKASENDAHIKFMDSVGYYLNNKIPVALRGNVFGLKFFSSEVQDSLAHNFLYYDDPKETREHLNAGSFSTLLKSGVFPDKYFLLCLDFFCVDTKELIEFKDVDKSNKNWQQILSLAYLAIYLIDFFHYFDDSTQWEEERAIFFKLIVQWNKNASSPVYLYNPGDVDENDYLKSMPPEYKEINYRLRQIYKPRGERFLKRHDEKTVKKWGVFIKPLEKERLKLNVAENFRSLMITVKSYASNRSR